MKIQDIVATLTLEEKCALLSGADVFKTRSFLDKGIPSIWLTDGPHGLRKQSGASDHLGLNPSEPAVCYPTAATAACSWDPALGEEIGEALGEEAIEQGVNVVLGPGLNMKRSPLCGRNFEYFSEDPYLAGKLAAGYVRGIQKRGIAACPKHFAVNNQETRRMASDSIVDERTLRELYLTGFEIVVKEASPMSIMSSYNRINGVYANENTHLLQDILKKDWGYQGAVVTDWGCSNDHALGVRSGSTLEMPCPGWDSVRELLAAVNSGKVTQQDVNDRVTELLTLIEATTKEERKQLSESTEVLYQKHRALAHRAAAKCLTLLKNEDSLLPLEEGTKIALIGDFAEHPRYQGAGSSQVNVSQPQAVLDCLRNSELTLAGYARGYDRLGRADERLKAEAVALADSAPVVVLCMGLDEVQESEGLDRTHMRLAQNQIELLRAVAEVNPNIVVVLFCGSVVETDWRSDCRALLYAGLGGQEGAAAVVDALTGVVNPGGKLAETWAEKYEDSPAKNHFARPETTVEYREALYIGYRYYQKSNRAAAFPFGFGLSYTTFTYSKLVADQERVTFTVSNTGSRRGTEVAQLYVAKKDLEKSIVFRPVRELKGFARIELEPGESKTVSIALDDKAFRYWNCKSGQWEIESGAYLLEIGASSEQIELVEEISITGTLAPAPYEKTALPHYHSGEVHDVPDVEFEALLGKTIPKGKRRIDRHITFGEMKYGRSPIGWLACAILTGLLKRSLKQGKPDLNLLFIYNMPLHALAKMTSGAVSMGMVDGIVMELKGFWIIGLLRVLFETAKNQVLNHRMENKLSGKPMVS